MGGWNSGSIRRSFRLLDSELHKLTMSQIAHYLQAQAHVVGRLPTWFTLSHGGETGHRIGFERHVELPGGLGEPALMIGLTTTTPTYGGIRYWFVCPSRS